MALPGRGQRVLLEAAPRDPTPGPARRRRAVGAHGRGGRRARVERRTQRGGRHGPGRVVTAALVAARAGGVALLRGPERARHRARHRAAAGHGEVPPPRGAPAAGGRPRAQCPGGVRRRSGRRTRPCGRRGGGVVTMLDDDRLAELFAGAAATFEVPESGVDEILARAERGPGRGDAGTGTNRSVDADGDADGDGVDRAEAPETPDELGRRRRLVAVARRHRILSVAVVVVVVLIAVGTIGAVTRAGSGPTVTALRLGNAKGATV